MRARCNLARIRGERSIAEMARNADIPRPYLSQIESGIRLPSDGEAEAIAGAYGVTLAEMYDWEEMVVLGVALDPKEDRT